MAPFNGVPTHSQQVVLALMPKVAATLSISGSGYIVIDCFRRRRKTKDQNTYRRLMIGLSVCDLLMSAGLFTSTWPMPKETPHVWGAVGTVESCEAIGFLEQAGVIATMYNGSLSTYYLLKIRYGWTSSQIACVEPWMHAIPLIFGIATMIASLKLNLFNSGLFDCWIAPFPQGCQESWRNNGETTCGRGDNASLYQWLFDLIPKWTSILLVTINMVMTHQAVYRQERRALRFSAPHVNPEISLSSSFSRPKPKPRVARLLARQSYLYVGALYLTYVPVIMTRLTELIAGGVYYGMLLTISITIPLQGFWNGTYSKRKWVGRGSCFPFYNSHCFLTYWYYASLKHIALVYIRPRYLQARQRQKQAEIRRRSHSSAQSIVPGFGFLRAVSEAVRDEDVSDEDEDEDREEEEEEEEDTGNTLEDSKE
jgi:hypothetical protein